MWQANVAITAMRAQHVWQELPAQEGDLAPDSASWQRFVFGSHDGSIDCAIKDSCDGWTCEPVPLAPLVPLVPLVLTPLSEDD